MAFALGTYRPDIFADFFISKPVFALHFNRYNRFRHQKMFKISFLFEAYGDLKK